MKKITLSVLIFISFLFFGVNSVIAETVEIDTSLDNHTGELYIDPDIIDFDSYIHESDSGVFIIQNNKLIPLSIERSSTLTNISPLAATQNYLFDIPNGTSWLTMKYAAYNQRITFEHRPQSVNSTYTRKVQINSSNRNYIYYDSMNYGGRASFSFNAKANPRDHIYFRVIHYSAPRGYYNASITM